jgi:hypothetical protein
MVAPRLGTRVDRESNHGGEDEGRSRAHGRTVFHDDVPPLAHATASRGVRAIDD